MIYSTRFSPTFFKTPFGLLLGLAIIGGLITVSAKGSAAQFLGSRIARAESVIQDSVRDDVPTADQNSSSEVLVLDSANDHSTLPEDRRFTLTHLFQILMIATIIIWGYSLVMSGKHGQGWLVLLAIAGVFAYILRAIKSVFVEVASSNEVSDWDDE